MVLFYGFASLQRDCPELLTTPTDKGNCSATVNNIDPILKQNETFNDFLYTISGVTSASGIGSVSGFSFNKGISFVTYRLKTDTTDKCTFVINIEDKEAPVIKCLDTVVPCFQDKNYYTLKLDATDNCGIDSVEFEIMGATFRKGTGTDASGFFNVGNTNIYWTVWDSAGNVSYCTNHIRFEKPWKLKIPKAYQVKQGQSEENTIYLGYNNNTIRLVAYTSGGITPAQYEWSTGEKRRFVFVRHDTPGTYKHSVKVTGPNGCIQTAETTIKVVDNYCSNPIKDIITTYFPWLQAEPWINEILKNISTVKVCVNGQTKCIAPSEIKSYINKGAVLGECSNRMPLVTSTKPIPSFTGTSLNVTVLPNPSSHDFILKVTGNVKSGYTYRVLDVAGKTLLTSATCFEEQHRFGKDLAKGIYFLQVSIGKEKKLIRLVKL